MKIAIITMHGVWNYGSVLQSLATNKFFSDLECEVEFINYKRDDYKSIAGFMKDLRKRNSLIVFAIKAIIILPTLIRWKKIFGGFCKKNLNISSIEYTSEEDLEKNTPIADIYCTGSDQVWNSTLNKGILEPFFLKFVPKDKPCISFSASFGKKQLENWEKEKTLKLLSRYQYITVRESSGVTICQDLGLKNIHQILDPTLLQSEGYWLKLIKKRNIKKDYLLVYQLHKEDGLDDYIRKLSKKLNLEIVRVCYRYDEYRKLGKSLLIPSVEELLSAIYHASLIITDSFHVTAFSTNFNKKFISIVPEHQFGGRISSLLQKIGLEQMTIHNFNDFSPLNYEANWEKVNKIYEEERKKTRSFFSDLLNQKIND